MELFIGIAAIIMLVYMLAALILYTIGYDSNDAFFMFYLNSWFLTVVCIFLSYQVVRRFTHNILYRALSIFLLSILILVAASFGFYDYYITSIYADYYGIPVLECVSGLCNSFS